MAEPEIGPNLHHWEERGLKRDPSLTQPPVVESLLTDEDWRVFDESRVTYGLGQAIQNQGAPEGPDGRR